MTLETRQAIGNHIKTLRKANNLTQEKFALMVGIERSHLARIESGSRNAGIDSIEKIANGFALTLAEFFAGVQAESEIADTDKPRRSYFHGRM